MLCLQIICYLFTQWLGFRKIPFNSTEFIEKRLTGALFSTLLFQMCAVNNVGVQSVYFNVLNMKPRAKFNSAPATSRIKTIIFCRIVVLLCMSLFFSFPNYADGRGRKLFYFLGSLLFYIRYVKYMLCVGQSFYISITINELVSYQTCSSFF